MLLDKSWHSVDEVAHKYGLERGLILQWIEEGIVRAEESKDKIVRVNVDDVELKVQEMTGI